VLELHRQICLAPDPHTLFALLVEFDITSGSNLKKELVQAVEIGLD
jgi:hypothetical protein